ncbi:hypothetical protein JCM16303_002105 [Sporobolomyces ruberrimus]
MPALPPPSSFAARPSNSSSETYESSSRTLNPSTASPPTTSSSAPVSLTVKLEWIERLSSPGVPLSTLKESLDYLDSSSWEDLVAERHMENLCPYPTCSKRASIPYHDREDDGAGVERKFKLHGGALYDAGPRTDKARDKGPYCSIKCRSKSEWVKGVLQQEGRRGLLEDVEKRREMVSASTREIVREKEKGQFLTLTTERKDKHEEKETFKADLLSSLTVHENPTISSNPPVAPSLESGSIDFERPAPTPSSRSTPSSRFLLDPSASSSSSKPLLNTSSALLPFTTTSLGRTILSSSRRSTPSSSSSRTLPVPASRQPRTGINGLPPVKFVSEPRMVDSKGREIEWADENEGLEGEEAELVRDLLDEALRVRRMVEKGEL